MKVEEQAGFRLLAGVLYYPQAWECVSERVAELGPKSMWIEDAWKAVADAHEQCPELNLPAFVERLEVYRKVERAGDGLTQDDQDGISAIAALRDRYPDLRSVLSEADRFARERANKQVARGLRRVADLVESDPRLDARPSVEQAGEKLRGWYIGQETIPVTNAGEGTERTLSFMRRAIIPTGFADIDKQIGGLPIGLLTLVGARTGCGKSTFLLGLARNLIFPRSADPSLAEPSLASQRLKTRTGASPYVLLISSELTADMIWERLACDMLDIASDDMRHYRANAVDAKLRSPASKDYIEALKSHGHFTVIDEADMGNVSIAVVCATIRVWADAVQAEDPDATMLVMVDYLQRIDPTKSQAKEARHRQIELAAKSLATLAKTRGIAIVAAEQLNDSIENAEPIRGDCRESKGANNEAGLILLLHTWSASQRAALESKYGHDSEVTQCMSVLCDKARAARDGWRAVLCFDGAHYRIRGASNHTNYLLDRSAIKSAKSVATT